MSFMYPEVASECLRSYSELLACVSMAGDEYLYVLSQIPVVPDEPQKLDAAEVGRAIQRIAAHAETADRLHASIEVQFGGPQDVTGYGSLIDKINKNTGEWRRVVHQIHGEAKRALMVAIASDLKLDEPSGGR